MSRNRLAFEFYDGLVKNLIRDNSTRLLEFEELPHSKIIVANLISTANEEIDIFWRTLKQPIWRDGEVYNAVIDAIERGVTLKVAIQQDTGRTSPTREILFDYNIPVIQLSEPELADTNFISCDERSYASWKYSANKGTACFNAPGAASTMKVVYGFSKNMTGV